MKKIAWMALGLLMSTTAAVAADSSAGCGLGSLIWKQNSIISGMSRMTTNQSFSSQLFGITSGTSGCSRHSIVKRENAPVYYAEANFEELKAEMSQGKGEYVAIFSDALGCPESEKSHFMALTQANYNKIFPSHSTSALDMLKEVKGVVQSSPKLRNQCPYALL